MKVLRLVESALINIDEGFAETPRNLGKMASSMHSLRQIISSNSQVEDFPQDVIFKSNAHKVILQALDPVVNQGHQKLIQEAIWCLSNIGLSSEARIRELIELRVVELVRPYLDSMDPVIIESELWMFANMLGETGLVKEPLIRLGFIDFIMTHFNKFRGSPKLSGVLAWFASNFVKARPEVNREIGRSFVKTLVPLLEAPYNTDTVEETVWMLSFYLDNADPDIKFIHTLGIIPKLKTLFETNYMTFILPITRIFGKLALGSSTLVQTFLDKDFKRSLIGKLTGFYPSLQCDSLWILSNLVLTGTKEMEFFNEPDTINLVQRILFDANSKIAVKRFAMRVLYSFMSQYSYADRENLFFNKGYVDCIFHVMETRDRTSVLQGLNYLEKVLIDALNFESTK